MTLKSTSRIALAALAVAGVVGVSACSSDGGGTADGEERTDLTLAVFNGWDEGIASSWLWKTILEEEGYTVELEMADVAPVFSGLQSGDYDFTTDVWLPVTHAEYLEEYGDDIVELGAWNEESALTVAVNEDSPIQSLDELADNADAFGNTIVGIEPAAGLTGVMEDAVIPDYGLEDMEFVTSSTAAMLTELDTAMANDEDIVVTLWEPHWAYGAYDIRNLEDPEGSLGDVESIVSYGSQQFADEAPQAAEWLSNFEMDLDTLYSLETAMFVDYDGDDYAPIVEQWIEDNQEYVDGLTA